MCVCHNGRDINCGYSKIAKGEKKSITPASHLISKNSETLKLH